jgi:hypothetical protein
MPRYLLGADAVAICDSVLTGESRDFAACVGLVPKQRARDFAPTEHHRRFLPQNDQLFGRRSRQSRPRVEGRVALRRWSRARPREHH